MGDGRSIRCSHSSTHRHCSCSCSCHREPYPRACRARAAYMHAWARAGGAPVPLHDGERRLIRAGHGAVVALSGVLTGTVHAMHACMQCNASTLDRCTLVQQQYTGSTTSATARAALWRESVVVRVTTVLIDVVHGPAGDAGNVAAGPASTTPHSAIGLHYGRDRDRPSGGPA